MLVIVEKKINMTISRPRFQEKQISNRQVYLAKNGQVVIEAENTELQGDWEKVTVDGRKSVLWDANKNSYGKVPSGQTLSYVFETDEAGQYSIAMYSARRKSAMNNVKDRGRGDTGNDAYVAIIEEQTGKVVQSSTKLFTGLGSLDEKFKWGNTFDGHHKKMPAQVRLNKNTQYRLEVSGRSDGYVIDRITLSNDGFLKNTTIAESKRKGNSPSPIPTPTPNNSITVEAESMKLSGEYRVENNKWASGGKVISLKGGDNNGTGAASFDFAGGTGHYKVIIDAFDESDGSAQIGFERNGKQLADFTLDKQLGSTLANNQTMTSLEIADVFVSSGDEFTLHGIEQGNNWTAEHARIDSITFEPIANYS